MGKEFMILNGSTVNFKFNESISFFVDCNNQEEVDEIWEKLTSNGGEEGRCGWLKDKFVISWQIIPKAFSELMGDSNSVKSKRVIDAMMKIRKIEIADLRKAYEEV